PGGAAHAAMGAAQQHLAAARNGGRRFACRERLAVVDQRLAQHAPSLGFTASDISRDRGPVKPRGARRCGQAAAPTQSLRQSRDLPSPLRLFAAWGPCAPVSGAGAGARRQAARLLAVLIRAAWGLASARRSAPAAGVDGGARSRSPGCCSVPARAAAL